MDTHHLLPLIDQIKAHQDLIGRLSEDSLDEAIKSGDLLITIKDAMPYKEFHKFLDGHGVAIKRSQRALYMKAAAHKDLLSTYRSTGKLGGGLAGFNAFITHTTKEATDDGDTLARQQPPKVKPGLWVLTRTALTSTNLDSYWYARQIEHVGWVGTKADAWLIGLTDHGYPTSSKDGRRRLVSLRRDPEDSRGRYHILPLRSMEIWGTYRTQAEAYTASQGSGFRAWLKEEPANT